jgi:2'-5' RNA ligase
MDHRLFYALWPDDATRSALLALQSQLSGGRPTPAANLHLTLAFLGRQPSSALPALRGIPARWPDFDCSLRFEKFGYFQRPRIAWTGMHDVPASLSGLQQSLLDALEEEKIVLSGEQGHFVPHVTLMRNAPAPTMQEIAPVVWRATRIVLAESVATPNGVAYHVLATNGDEDGR